MKMTLTCSCSEERTINLATKKPVRNVFCKKCGKYLIKDGVMGKGITQ
jgi:hypothetical protein